MEQRPGPGLRPLLFCLLVSLVLWAVLASCVFAAQAFADEPGSYVAPSDLALEPELPELAACPSDEVPIVAEEEAEAVAPELRELGHLRMEQQQSCRAQRDRLDQVIERLWWIVAEQLRSHQQGVVTNETLSGLLNQDCSNPCSVYIEGQSKPLDVGATEAVPVFDSTGSEAVAASVDASGEALKGGLYFVAGIIVAGFVCYVLYRQVMPRA